MEEQKWRMNAKEMYDSLEVERGLSQMRQENYIYREIRTAMINSKRKCNISTNYDALYNLTLDHLKEDGFVVTIERLTSDCPTLVISWEHINQPNT